MPPLYTLLDRPTGWRAHSRSTLVFPVEEPFGARSYGILNLQRSDRSTDSQTVFTGNLAVKPWCTCALSFPWKADCETTFEESVSMFRWRIGTELGRGDYWWYMQPGDEVPLDAVRCFDEARGIVERRASTAGLLHWFQSADLSRDTDPTKLYQRKAHIARYSKIYPLVLAHGDPDLLDDVVQQLRRAETDEDELRDLVANAQRILDEARSRRESTE